MTNTSDHSNDNNSHLRSHLEYYKTLSDPGYGLLVTGKWGSGKTFQLKEILKPAEYFYISLFGTQTTNEVYASVYAKMYPITSNALEIAKGTNGIGIGPINIGNLVSGLAGAFIKEEVNNTRIVIFDDFERSKISANDLLGVFNNYIEHHKCKVIVIAHDEKIKDELKHIKEKVFGLTIEITPQTSKAFDSFTSKITNSATKSLIQDLKSSILNIFDQSGTYSLRILKHSIEDLSRLLDTLSDEHRNNQEAILYLTCFFLAISLEVKAGNLIESDLIERNKTITMSQYQVGKKNSTEVASAIFKANSRYPSLYFGNTILKDKTLIDLTIKGIYIPTEIHSSLNETLFFTKPDDLPSWLAFIKFDEISDIESKAAAEKLKKEFTERSITEPGEILHLFALRFLLAEMELISGDISEIEQQCEEYLNDLLNQSTISPYTDDDNVWGIDFLHSYEGHSFWVEDSYKPNFKKLRQRLKETQIEAAKKLYPEYTKQILSLMATDGAEFAEKISHTNKGNNIFASIDVLSQIHPSDFIQEWMGSEPKNWQYISKGLEQRYRGGELYRSLKSEKTWLQEVINLIDIEHKKSTQIRKKRIQRAISPALREAVKL